MMNRLTHWLGACAAAGALLLAQGAAAATFKVAIGDAQGGTQWELATKFKTLFEQKTGGKHKLDLFPNGQLGSERRPSATRSWADWTSPCSRSTTSRRSRPRWAC